MSTRFITGTLLAVLGGFIVVVSQAFAPNPLSWVAFAIGVAIAGICLLAQLDRSRGSARARPRRRRRRGRRATDRLLSGCVGDRCHMAVFRLCPWHRGARLRRPCPARNFRLEGIAPVGPVVVAARRTGRDYRYRSSRHSRRLTATGLPARTSEDKLPTDCTRRKPCGPTVVDRKTEDSVVLREPAPAKRRCRRSVQ